MASRDLIPSKDNDFDILQNKIFTQTRLNADVWNIPLAEINFLQPFKTVWDNTWTIAKDKDNRTKLQVRAKDNARESYEKVLRDFIQKWIMRNAFMANDNREACGIRPKVTVRKASQPITESRV